MVWTPCSHCQGPVFNPWLGNQVCGDGTVMHSCLPGQGTKIHKQGSIYQKSHHILTDILPSDFKVISPEVLVLSHLGCASKVSCKKTTQVEPGSINSFCKWF